MHVRVIKLPLQKIFIGVVQAKRVPVEAESSIPMEKHLLLQPAEQAMYPTSCETMLNTRLPWLYFILKGDATGPEAQHIEI